MTKEVADKLLESGEAMLGGNIQEATVLFSDMRDFTSIAERLGARKTVAMLNEYFTVMVDCIFHAHGILDKYIGDALLAVFGAPFIGDRDADHAVEAAIEMVRALQLLNAKRARAGEGQLQMGVGINTDEILTGNIVSIKRMDYTCIGDGVNLASRLERLNKHFRTNIIISEHTLRRLKGQYTTRRLDRIRVKGKSEPVTIYEVLDYLDLAQHPQLAEAIGLFESGLDLFQERRWEEAEAKLEQVLELSPDDTAAHIYLSRAQRHREMPPPDDWDGVWVMETK